MRAADECAGHWPDSPENTFALLPITSCITASFAEGCRQAACRCCNKKNCAHKRCLFFAFSKLGQGAWGRVYMVFPGSARCFFNAACRGRAPAPIAPAAPLISVRGQGRKPAPPGRRASGKTSRTRTIELSGKQCAAATRRRAEKLDRIVWSDRILAEEQAFLPPIAMRVRVRGACF